jgi:DNA-binding transcriptional ArsR family regulator
MKVDADRIREGLACLTESSRFRIARTLLEGERYVSSLAGRVGLSQSCTTRHLQALERAGLVVRQRVGKRVLYRLRLDRPEVETLRGMLAPPPAPAAPVRRPRAGAPRARESAAARASRPSQTASGAVRGPGGEPDPVGGGTQGAADVGAVPGTGDESVGEPPRGSSARLQPGLPGDPGSGDRAPASRSEIEDFLL